MSTTTDQPQVRKEGFVYIIKSETMPSLYKIGRTSRSPFERIDELSASTGVPVSFELLCAVFVKDSYLLEKRMHDSFSERRISSSREFFKFIGDSEAKQKFISVLVKNKELIETLGLEQDDNQELQKNILRDMMLVAEQKKELESYRKILSNEEKEISEFYKRLENISMLEGRKKYQAFMTAEEKDADNLLYLYNAYKKDRKNLFAYLRSEQAAIHPDIIKKSKKFFV
jgi:hypothetical protein